MSGLIDALLGALAGGGNFVMQDSARRQALEDRQTEKIADREAAFEDFRKRLGVEQMSARDQALWKRNFDLESVGPLAEANARAQAYASTLPEVLAAAATVQDQQLNGQPVITAENRRAKNDANLLRIRAQNEYHPKSNTEQIESLIRRAGTDPVAQKTLDIVGAKPLDNGPRISRSTVTDSNGVQKSKYEVIDSRGSALTRQFDSHEQAAAALSQLGQRKAEVRNQDILAFLRPGATQGELPLTPMSVLRR